MDDYKAGIVEEIMDMHTLLFKVSKIINRNMLEEACAIAPTQLAAITALKKQSPMNMTQLSEFLSIPRQQLTKVMDALVAKGLVNRYTDPDNRRAVMAEISAKGQEFINDFIQDKKNSISQFIDILNEEQKKELFDAFHTIKRIMSEIGSEL